MDVESVDTAWEHACALKSDATVWCWGSNVHGQLGDGTTINQSIPVQVQNVTGVTQVSTGYAHTCAMKSDGTVACWGWNVYGVLGNGGERSAISTGAGQWNDDLLGLYGLIEDSNAGLSGITLVSKSKGQPHLCHCNRSGIEMLGL
jgi:alpha-tubulin suppressor-like RCC1 family protein